MTDLPPGWAQTTLGEVLERIETGKSFSGEGRPALPDEWGVIKVSAMTYGSFRENENKAVRAGTAFSETAEIKPGDLLLSRANTRDYVGASALVGNCRPRLLLSDKSLRLVPTEAIDRRWLWYALSSPTARQYMSNASSGVKAGMRNISQDSLRSMLLTVPPLEEQRRIVVALEDHLSRLDAGLRYLQRSEATATQLIQWICDAAACGGLLTGLMPRPGELSPGWTWKCPDNVTSGHRSDITIGPFGSNLKVSDYRDNGIPLVFVRNIRTGHFGNVDTKFVSAKKAAELNAHRATPGDVLVTKMGDPPGDACVYSGSSEAIITADCIRLRPSAEFRPDYLALAINSRLVRAQMEHIARGVAQKKVSLQRFRQEIKLPIASKDNQDQVMAIVKDLVDQIDRTKNASCIAQRDAAQLRRSLLAEAFAGRLVPQDPNDGPTSVLLERIRAARAAQPKARHTRRSRQSDTTQEIVL